MVSESKRPLQEYLSDAYGDEDGFVKVHKDEIRGALKELLAIIFKAHNRIVPVPPCACIYCSLVEVVKIFPDRKT